MTEPYIADRATLIDWADNGDDTAARYLRDYPKCDRFGIDDGDVCVAFNTDEGATGWLSAMIADSAEQRANRA